VVVFAVWQTAMEGCSWKTSRRIEGIGCVLMEMEGRERGLCAAVLEV
jgi:hypothetical protein